MESKLPRRELEIAARVRQVREQLGMSQPELAGNLEISRVRLASYEYGRAPLPYIIGVNLCAIFDINQRWLAEGKPPMIYEVRFNHEIKVPKRALFSHAYDVYFKGLIEHNLKETARNLGCKEEEIDPLLARFTDILEPSSMTPRAAEAQLKIMLRAMLNRMPDDLLGAYYRTLTQANSKFWKAHRDRLKENHPIDLIAKLYLSASKNLSENR